MSSVNKDLDYYKSLFMLLAHTHQELSDASFSSQNGL
jgi:hypothetical protein